MSDYNQNGDKDFYSFSLTMLIIQILFKTPFPFFLDKGPVWVYLFSLSTLLFIYNNHYCHSTSGKPHDPTRINSLPCSN